MNKAELYVHYWQNPLPFRKPAPIEHASGTVAVLPYHLWIKNKCKCCGKGGASGIWRCEFTSHVVPSLLCAACGMLDAFAKLNGFFSPKLIKIDLMLTLTYQSRSATKEELHEKEVEGD